MVAGFVGFIYLADSRQDVSGLCQALGFVGISFIWRISIGIFVGMCQDFDAPPPPAPKGGRALELPPELHGGPRLRGVPEPEPLLQHRLALLPQPDAGRAPSDREAKV